MAKPESQRIAEIIDSHCGWWIGWSLDTSTAKENRESAARDILDYLKRRDSQLNRSKKPVVALSEGE